MKVSVVRMWHEGRKLTDAELKAEPESHGYLEVEPGCAYLRARVDGHHAAIPFLFDPVLRHLRGDAFVLVGHETVPGGNAYDRRPQSWWCRLAPDSASPASALPPPASAPQKSKGE